MELLTELFSTRHVTVEAIFNSRICRCLHFFNDFSTTLLELLSKKRDEVSAKLH